MAVDGLLLNQAQTVHISCISLITRHTNYFGRIMSPVSYIYIRRANSLTKG